MTLKSLINSYHWLSVEITLLDLYPDQIKNIERYRAVFEELKTINPSPSDITLVIKEVVDDEEEGTTFSEVFGRQSEEEHGLALEFKPWDKWLGFSINEQTLKNYNKLEITAHCLYEMTFYGFDEDTIQQQWKEIEDSAKELENMSDEERKANTMTLEEFKQFLEEHITQEDDVIEDGE
jgi:DNA gyrase/topoisomerase IV subunit A